MVIQTAEMLRHGLAPSVVQYSDGDADADISRRTILTTSSVSCNPALTSLVTVLLYFQLALVLASRLCQPLPKTYPVLAVGGSGGSRGRRRRTGDRMICFLDPSLH